MVQLHIHIFICLLFVISQLFIQCTSFSLHNKNADKNYKIVCYYTNWAQYRPAPANFFPENIDPWLCTHIIFSFAKINDNLELAPFEWNDISTAWIKGMYQKTVSLKKINKNLKVLIAVGGWNMGSKPFSDMAMTKRSRNNFADKAVEFLKKYRFDGLDLDWEYPASRDTKNRPDDRFYFTELCIELNHALKPHGLILTAAVAAGEKYIQSAYEMNEIHKYLDFINLMSYDLRGPWDSKTGHNAPLYPNYYDKQPKLTVDYAVETWLNYVPREKLILGIATYGRSFKLRDGFESCPLTDTPAIGHGTKGKFSAEEGFLMYFEVCQKIRDSNWQYVWNDKQKVPYAYSDEETIQSDEIIEWVGFDDVKSAEVKVKYAMKKGLGGAMLWSLDMDDFTGEFCKQGKYPILTTINHYMNPKGKFKMPRYEISENNNGEFKPRLESDFISPVSKEIDALSSRQLTSTNIFGLMKNDEIQVYKFCQCKNGTHHLKTDSDKDFSFIVDCNKKRASHASAISVEDQLKEKYEEDNYRLPGKIYKEINNDYFTTVHKDKPKKSGFFLLSFLNGSNKSSEINYILTIFLYPFIQLFIYYYY